MESKQELIQKVKKLISINQTGKALEILAKEQLSTLDKQIIMLNNRFNKIKDDQRLGIIEDNDARLELNKINNALLELAEVISAKPTNAIQSKTSDQKKDKKNHRIWIGLAILSIVVIGSVWYSIDSKSNKEQSKYDLLLTQADSLYNNQNFEQAETKYKQISNLKIDNKIDVNDKLKACRKEIEFKKSYEEGNEYEKKNKLSDALQKYNEALSIKPDNDNVAEAKKRVTEILSKPKRKSWEEKFLDKYVALRDESTGKVITALGATDATELHLAKFEGYPSQFFKLIEIKKDLYALECKIKYGLILTTSRRNYSNTKDYSKPGPLWLYQWAAGDKRPGGNQTWKMIHRGENKFSIQNNNSELYIGESSDRVFQLSKGESKTWLLYLEGEKQK